MSWYVLILLILNPSTGDALFFKQDEPYATEEICTKHLRPSVDDFVSQVRDGRVQLPANMKDGQEFKAGCYQMQEEGRT